MLLKSCHLFKSGPVLLRESPAPILCPHPPRCPDEVGADIIEDQLWRAVGGKCDREIFLKSCIQVRAQASGSIFSLAMTTASPFSPLSWLACAGPPA